MSVSADRVTLGSMPRRASLAPSSRITASVPSGTDQSSRSRPPEEVSPETPALIISTSIPLAFKDFCSLAGNAAEACRPRPALSESPKTTILIGFVAGTAGTWAGACTWAEAVPAVTRAITNTSMCTNTHPCPSTAAAEVPYDRAMDSLIEPSSLAGLEPDTISISNVNLSLGAGAARVHILKDISLRVAQGEAIGPIRPIASPCATRRLISLRICTRAAPAPSERLTFEMEMVSGSRPANDEGSMRLSMARSYGTSAAAVEGQGWVFVHILVLVIALVTAGTASAQVQAPAQAPAVATTKPIKMVVLGDSLSAGLGLQASAAFPARLQKSLKAKGIDIDMINAGVSGDTSSGGRDRLDWSVPEGTEAVILELGANDALRGIDPKVTRSALTDILTRLKARKIAVLLCGMVAPPNYGSDYSARFNAIYPDLANAFAVPLYPFFLEGVAADARLNQADGMHPTAEGVDVIVKNILPSVEAFLGTISGQRS